MWRAIPRPGPRRRSRACRAWRCPRYPELRLAVSRPGTVRRLMAAVPARPGALRDGVLDRPHGPARRGRGRRAGVSSYHTDFGRYAEAYGMPLAAPGRHGLPDAVPPPEPAGIHAVGGSQGGARRRSAWTGSRSGGGVSTRRRSIRAGGARQLRETLGMGSRFTFVYVGRLAPEKRVDVVMEAFRQASAIVPAGRHPPHPRGDRAVRGRAQGVGAGRRHLSWLPRPSHAAARPLRQLRRVRVRVRDRDPRPGGRWRRWRAGCR